MSFIPGRERSGTFTFSQTFGCIGFELRGPRPRAFGNGCHDVGNDCSRRGFPGRATRLPSDRNSGQSSRNLSSGKWQCSRFLEYRFFTSYFACPTFAMEPPRSYVRLFGQHWLDDVFPIACKFINNLPNESQCFCSRGEVFRGILLLQRDRSILIITLLFGGARDEKSGVRAAAVRALGMLVTMPSLEEDTGFLMDLADIVCLAIDDENLGVRVKACWALANLCDCLIRRKDNKTLEPIPEETLLPRLYSTVVKAGQDDCKVKCNAMRAVGSVIRLSADQQILSDVSAGLTILSRCAGSEKDMKVILSSINLLTAPSASKKFSFGAKIVKH